MLKELDKDQATAVSAEKVSEVDRLFVEQLKRMLADMTQHAELLGKTPASYDEAMQRVQAFKRYVEDQDGYRLVNPGDRPPYTEKEVQLLFALA